MLQLSHYSFNLPFEYPFTIAKGTKTHQPALVTSLGIGNLRGFGEAPAIHYYDVTVEGMVELLESKRALIERYALTDPERFWHFLHHLLPGSPFLVAALDIAGWDLFGQLRRMPLYKMLGLVMEQAPVTDYTIGLDTPEKMAEKITAHPWPLYKIKMRNAADIELLAQLRAITDKPFRVDANESLNLEDAKRLLPDLQALGVTMLEQPLPRSEDESMPDLKSISPIPIFADESCRGEQDVARCRNGFHGINIKLTKCSGITPALRMIREARNLELKIMLGSMNESTIGAAAIAHLAPLTDEIDADGPLLLSDDIAEGIKYDEGKILLSNLPGLGIRFWGTPRKKGE